ncbi:MAG: MerR family transcriptional regulator [Methylococcales bacterium]|nr:MerR family transcriptional regulator [Methylococcales bacterium]
MLFQVKELAQHCDVPPDTIRHYTRIGLLQPTRDPDNGYKLFSVSDTKRLGFIRRAKNLGFSLNEIELILVECQKGNSPCSLVRDLMGHRIKVNRVRMEELMALQIRMEQALNNWTSMSNGSPGGDCFCQLIESIGINYESTAPCSKAEEEEQKELAD